MALFGKNFSISIVSSIIEFQDVSSTEYAFNTFMTFHRVTPVQLFAIMREFSYKILFQSIIKMYQTKTVLCTKSLMYV